MPELCVNRRLCAPLPVTVVVALDSNDDGSAELTGRFGPDVRLVAVDARNVGAAKGCRIPVSARIA